MSGLPSIGLWLCDGEAVMCKLISYVVPENPFMATSRAVGTSRCETHNWDFGFGYPVGEGTLCPLGRIEQAIEEGLEKLQAHTPTG